MRLIAISLLGFFSSLSLAADVAGSSDLELLERFPRAQISDYRVVEEVERLYPLGSVRRLSGRLRYERELNVVGRQTSVTYALPAGHSHLEAFAQAREALRIDGAALLYWCEGRECGSSALWANTVFANAQLNGGDDQQAYALLRLKADEDDRVLALYAVTRGNRRAYLLAEQLELRDPLDELLPVPATLLRLLRAGEALPLESAETPPRDWVELLARTLNQDITLRVLLRGPQASAWRDALAAAGVRAARLEAEDSPSGELVLSRVR